MTFAEACLPIARLFAIALKGRGYDALTSEAERHGAWEWTATRREGSLNRFVQIAVIEKATGLGSKPVAVVETWVGADDDQCFTRRMIAHFELPSFPNHAFEPLISQSVLLALDNADSLTRMDLETRIRV